MLPSFRSEKVSWLCDGPGCICVSACALIWFGAPDRTGEVGLHRPRFEGPAFKALSPAEAARTYRRMLDGIVGYLEEMETPKPLIEAMVSTSSAEIQWFGFVKNDLRPPSFAEWTDASCGQFTNQEYDKEIELSANREK